MRFRRMTLRQLERGAEPVICRDASLCPTVPEISIGRSGQPLKPACCEINLQIARLAV